MTVGRHQPLPLLCRFNYHAPRNGVALELLLSYGADVTATSPEGQTAMQLVTQHLENEQDFANRQPANDHGAKGRARLLQSMLIALGHATHKMLESALVENDSLKQAAKRDAAAEPGLEPKTATRAKRSRASDRAPPRHHPRVISL